MTTLSNLTFDGASPFRLKRPRITTSGSTSDVDSLIKSHLDDLNGLLGKRIFKHTSRGDTVAVEDNTGKTRSASRVTPDIKSMLALPLKAKLILEKPVSDPWEDKTLGHAFEHAIVATENLTLADYIDATADLSALKYAFQGNLSANWFNLDYNSKAVLNSYPAITDFLVAYGFHIMGIEDVNALVNFILSNNSGVKKIANYAVVSAGRTLIFSEKLEVPDFNSNSSDIVGKIGNAGLSLSSATYRSSVQTLINDFIFNKTESDLIDNAGIGTIPPGIKPQLIKFIKHSPVPIDAGNIKFFLPLFITQIIGKTDVADPTEVDTEEADKDFDVDFLTDDNSLVQISKSAIKCAAQLYYGMILGDELDVFDTVNYFTHKFLIRGGINIEDSGLRDDLQTYVFSSRFTDIKTNKILDRTRPAERQMFYRQVFNYGNGQVTDDLIPNTEFSKLWKTLILESAKYLERAQASPNPDSFVSRQNVMQAVEDLQYNLSTHCTGMANVITPLIYAELNFVIQRIFMHPEIVRQIVPAGGTWWRVVETLYMAMKNSRPKATVIYNKAKLGHDIIRSIADYDPSTFEDDKNFSAFISNVDAFITTQSILQEALTDDLKRRDDDDEESGQNGPRRYAPEPNHAPTGNGAKPAGDEWDF